MAYKIVNDDSLTSVANAIRVKGEISGTLEFPDGFVSAIQNLSPSGNDFIITASKDGQDNFTLDKTFAEIKSAYQAGKQLVVYSTDYIVSWYEYNDTGVASDDCFDIGVFSRTAQYDLVELDYTYYSSRVTSEVTDTYYYPNSVNATPSDVASGKTFINGSGRQTGTAIPPSGTYSITSNGIYNIVSFASVDVNVSGGSDHDVEDAIIDRTISGVYENSKVTSVGDYAFCSCRNLTTASFPNVTLIGSNAFSYCTSLTTANFPSATSIKYAAFSYCTSLTTANFPNVTSIGSNAFNRCTSLTTANFPNVTSIGNYAFAYCSSLTTANFPNVISIGNGAFSYCTGLTTASFPTGQVFGNQCFYRCSYLESLYVLASSVATLGTSALMSTPMSLSSYLGYFGSIYVPASLVDTYKSATNWSAYSARITSYTE